MTQMVNSGFFNKANCIHIGTGGSEGCVQLAFPQIVIMIGIHDHITAPTPNRDYSFGVLGKRRFDGFDTMDLQIRCCNSTIQLEADLQPFFWRNLLMNGA